MTTTINAITKSLTVKDIQKILGISRSKAYELIRQAPFPIIKLSKSIRIPSETFLNWFYNGNQKSTSEIQL